MWGVDRGHRRGNGLELGELKERWRAYPQEQYRCDRNLNLYQGPEQDGLVTQAAAGRQLVITLTPTGCRWCSVPMPTLAGCRCQRRRP